MNVRTVSGKKSSLFALFFTFAVDNLGATIVFPIFAPLFLDPNEGLLMHSASQGFRATILGFFLAAFPLSQLFFSPILGDYSDHAGRRRALIVTTAMTLSGYIIAALSIQMHDLYFLFVARLLMGIGAGNLSICMSSLSDISDDSKQKKQYFSLGSAIAGVTFVLGPLVGGKLSDRSLSHTFHPAFPMWVGGILSAVNLLFVYFAFQETIHKTVEQKFDFLKGLKNVGSVLKTQNVRNLFIVYLLYLLAWNIFFQFLPAYLVEHFKFMSSTIGDVCALLGVFWIIGTGIIYKFLHTRIPERWFLFYSLIAFALGTLALPFLTSFVPFLICIAVCTTISGIIWPLCTGAISDAADARMQGRVLGISQSVLSVSMVLAAVIGGVFLDISVVIPFFAGGLFLIGSGLLTFLCRFAEKVTN